MGDLSVPADPAAAAATVLFTAALLTKRQSCRQNHGPHQQWRPSPGSGRRGSFALCHLAAHVVHVERLHLPDQVVEGRCG